MASAPVARPIPQIAHWVEEMPQTRNQSPARPPVVLPFPLHARMVDPFAAWAAEVYVPSVDWMKVPSRNSEAEAVMTLAALLVMVVTTTKSNTRPEAAVGRV